MNAQHILDLAFLSVCAFTLIYFPAMFFLGLVNRFKPAAAPLPEIAIDGEELAEVETETAPNYSDVGVPFRRKLAFTQKEVAEVAELQARHGNE